MGLIWFLTFLHGCLSLGTEVLYFKTLDAIVGTNHVLPFLVVAGFIGGMSLGNYWGLRWQRLWLVEASLGFFHLILASKLTLGPQVMVDLQAFTQLSWMPTQLLFASLLLIIPAIGVGISFPGILALTRSRVHGPFLHALGATVGILAADHLLFLHLGLVHSLQVLAVGHGLLATGLYFQKFSATSPKLKFSSSVITAGVLTGSLQAYFLYMAPLLFEPFFYTLGTVVGIILLGLFLGGLSFKIWPATPARVLQDLSLAFGLTLIVQALWLTFASFTTLTSGWWLLGLISWVLPTAVIIGRLFPACLSPIPDRPEVAAININLSLGNVLGLLLLPVLTAYLVPMFTVGVLVLGLLLINWRHQRVWLVVPLLIFGILQTQDQKIMGLTSPTRPITIDKIFLSAGEYSGLYRHESLLGSRRRLYQTGFSPLDLDLKMENYIVEVAAGGVRGRTRALVLGVGSGRSAGAATQLFGHVDYVDLSQNTPALIQALNEDNFDLPNQLRAQFFPMDALLAPEALSFYTYDLIVLTVDPGYQWSAAKLYTIEYFKKLATKLNPNGRIVFWLDHSLSPAAQAILINTAQQVWPEINFFKLFSDELGPSYYLVIGGLTPLNYQPLRTDPYLQANNFFNTTIKSNKIHSLYHPAVEIFRKPLAPQSGNK